MELEIYKKVTKNLQNFTNEELNYIDKLIKDDILKSQDGNIILNKKYKVGIVKLYDDMAKVTPFGYNSKTISITKDKILNSYDGDIVLVKVIFNPRGGLKGSIVKIIKRNDALILGYKKEDKLYDMKNHFQLNEKILNTLEEGDIFLLKQTKIEEIIGNIEEPSIDEKISLYLFGENYRVNSNYDMKIKEIQDYSSRVNLTHLPFCTIDPISAKDHDDAIYFDEQNNILYVAIADVSAYIKEGSKLDKEAIKRAFSIYLPNKVLPMIPFSLSADLCSLKPDVKRLAYVMKMHLNTKTLEVIKSELLEAIIVSHHKYSYEDIDNKIDTNSLDNSLNALYNLTLKLRKKRLNKGYDFRTNEYRLKLDNDEKLIDVVEEQGSPSHKLVEECMLLANIQSARKLDNIGIFRIHEEPDRKKLEQLLKSLEMLGIKSKLKEDIHSTIISIQQKAQNVDLIQEVDKLIIQSQQQARYSSEISSHFGLGFSHYSHFTSPIRRYSDLILHRILKTKTIPKDIETICENISNQERNITKLVWDLEKRKYARWAKENIDNQYEAIVIQVEDEPKGAFSSGMVGLSFDIENYQGEQLFSEIKVKLISSDIITKKIIGKIIEI